jgi:phage FluMu gp28-like protein
MSPAAPNFFLPYQRRWIADRSALKIMEKSRQIGMSWAAAYSLVREQAEGRSEAQTLSKGVISRTEGRLYDAWVSSRDELQAELFIQDCANFAQILNEAAERVDRALLDDERPLLARSLRFANGRSIHALSSNPNAQAGKRGTRLLDEFALHPAPRELYTIALPGVTWGGRLEIISTHRGSSNFFNELIVEIKQKGNPKKFSHHKVTLEDALAQGFLKKLKEKLPSDDLRQKMTEENYIEYIRSQCADEAAFRQEYMCDPSFAESAFIPLSLILAAQFNTAASPLPAQVSGSLSIGVDLGRTHDRTVIFVLEKIGEMLFTRAIVTLEKTPFAEQEAALDHWASHPLCRAISIDGSGLGRQFAERALTRYGSHRVEMILFSDERKAQLAYELKDAFERRSLRIPDTSALRDDLMSVEKSYTSTGAIRFSAPRDASGHADHFWALSLAISASHRFSNSPMKIEIPEFNGRKSSLL